MFSQTFIAHVGRVTERAGSGATTRRRGPPLRLLCVDLRLLLGIDDV